MSSPYKITNIYLGYETVYYKPDGTVVARRTSESQDWYDEGSPEDWSIEDYEDFENRL